MKQVSQIYFRSFITSILFLSLSALNLTSCARDERVPRHQGERAQGNSNSNKTNSSSSQSNQRLAVPPAISVTNNDKGNSGKPPFIGPLPRSEAARLASDGEEPQKEAEADSEEASEADSDAGSESNAATTAAGIGAAVAPATAPAIASAVAAIEDPPVDLRALTREATGVDFPQAPLAPLSQVRGNSQLERDNLPPVLDALLVSLLALGELEPPHGDRDRRSLTTRARLERQDLQDEKLEQFMLVMRLLKHLYYEGPDHPRPAYSEPPIKTVEQYFNIVEPTRMWRSGSVKLDFEYLVQMALRFEASPQSVPRVPRIDLSSADVGPFGSHRVKDKVVLKTYRDLQNFRAMLRANSASIAGNLGGDIGAGRPMADAITRAMIGFFLDPRNLGDASVKLAEWVNQGSRNLPTEPDPIEAMNPTNVLVSVGKWAHKIDAIGRDEKVIIDLVSEMTKWDMERRMKMADAFRSAMSGVSEELRMVGTKAVNSKAFKFFRLAVKQNPKSQRAFDMLIKLIDRYPTRFSSEMLKDVVMDLFRLPRYDSSPDDTDVLLIVLKHGGMFLIDFLQGFTSDEEGLESLQDLLESFKDGNREVPGSAIWRQVLSDPNRYDQQIVPGSFDYRPLATGKAMQIHTAQLPDGSEWALRVIRPGAEERLNYEYHEILLPMADELAQFWFPNSPDPEGQMRAVLGMKKRDLEAEFRVEEAAQNQARAHELVGTSELIDLPNGDQFKLELRVPEVRPTQPGSTVMMMKLIKDGMDYETFKAENPAMARALAVAMMSKLYRGVVLDPYETGKNGWGHGDIHIKNMIIVKPRRDDPSGPLVLRVYLVDWGIVCEVTPSEAKAILLLSYGAGLFLNYAIVESLWELRSADVKVTKTNRTALARAVKRKIKNLRRKGDYGWGAAQWIEWAWRKGLLKFPDKLINIYGAKIKVDSLQRSLIGPKEGRKGVEDFLASLTAEYRWKVLKLAYEQYPLFSKRFAWAHPKNAWRWTKTGFSQVRFFGRDCRNWIHEMSRQRNGSVSPFDNDNDDD